MEEIEVLYSKTGTPRSLWGHIDHLYTDEDKRLILESDEDGYIDCSRYEKKKLLMFYRRGILNKEITEVRIRYRIADFSVRCESMIQCEKELWDQIPKESLKAVAAVRMDPENWLKDRIEAAKNGEKPGESVVPVEEVLSWLERAGGPFAAGQCNCQAYLGNCTVDKSDVCIHLVRGSRPNSSVDRGNSRLISREEAALIVKRADQDGLIHSLSEYGLCNCCSCCCYNFYNREKYEIKDTILLAPYRATVRNETCTGCRVCQARCRFDALIFYEGKMHVDTGRCWGCGICRTACKRNAITMLRLTTGQKDEVQLQ